jgi:hypothetical protein
MVTQCSICNLPVVISWLKPGHLPWLLLSIPDHKVRCVLCSNKRYYAILTQLKSEYRKLKDALKEVQYEMV